MNPDRKKNTYEPPHTLDQTAIFVPEYIIITEPTERIDIINLRNTILLTCGTKCSPAHIDSRVLINIRIAITLDSDPSRRSFGIININIIRSTEIQKNARDIDPLDSFLGKWVYITNNIYGGPPVPD